MLCKLARKTHCDETLVFLDWISVPLFPHTQIQVGLVIRGRIVLLFWTANSKFTNKIHIFTNFSNVKKANLQMNRPQVYLYVKKMLQLIFSVEFV
jgi:hypothetical protein